MNLTNYNRPQDAKQVLRDAITAGKTIILKQFSFDANLGGETLIFQIGDDLLQVSPTWLEDSNIVLAEEEKYQEREW